MCRAQYLQLLLLSNNDIREAGFEIAIEIQETEMRIFDSHCHLDDKVYDNDIMSVIERAADAGVTAMMVVGITLKSSHKAVNMAAAHPALFASVGVHPHDAAHCDDETLAALRVMADNPHVRAWGETGLDFNRMFSPGDQQEKWLARQIEAADDCGLPLIFHERDSKGRFLEILKAHTPNRTRKGVVHCFSGNRSELRQYLDLGLHIGITGIITIKTRGVELRDMATMIPADRLLVETDAPYLTPTPERNRFRRNEPAFVRTVLMKLAEVRGEAVADLAATVWRNTCDLFQVGEL